MKKLLSKIWNFVETMFSKVEREVEKLVPAATGIVEGVKRAVENPAFHNVLEVIKFTIPGDTDDKIINKALQLAQLYIPRIAMQLNIIKSITDIDDVNEQMIAVVNALKQASPDQQSDYWHELASFVLKTLADGKITLGEASAIVEYHYQNYVKK